MKVTDPRIARLYRESLKRRPNLADARNAVRNRRGPHRGRMPQTKREPLVVWDDLERAFSARLGHAGTTLAETKTWPAIAVGTRISRLERGKSTSPERQLENIASWCVTHRRRPVALVAEETSGSIFRTRTRKRFETFFDDIANDRIRDPENGELIDGIAYFQYDRFTREPDEGGRWLRLLLQKGINLYATQFNDPPRDLFQIEHEIRNRFTEAAREVDFNRARGMEAIEKKLRDGDPIYGCDLWGRERIVDPGTGKTVRYRAVPTCVQLAQSIARQIIDGKTVHAVVCTLREEGITTTGGGQFTSNSLMRLLRSPHVAGLMRVRLNPRRTHDQKYRGELFPAELIYAAGGAPPADYVPAIEPLIPYPLWAELQRVLDGRRRPRGRQATHLASGVFRCAICNSPIVAGDGNYRCSKAQLRYRRRTGYDTTTRTAADGMRHGSIAVELLDLLLEEVLFAAVDTTAVDLEPLRVEAEAQRGLLLERLRTLEERLGNTSYMLSQGHLTRSRYDELTEEIFAEKREVEAELRELAGEVARPTLPAGATLRELWAEMDISLKRQWVALVLEGGTLRYAPKGRWPGLADRVTFAFRDGYDPPADEVTALVERLDDSIRARHAGKTAPSPGLARRLRELHESELTNKEILERLVAEEWTVPGRGGWTEISLRYALKRVYAEAGLEYVPRSPVPRHRRIDDDTLDLIRRIYLASGRFDRAADDLNRLGMRRPNGSEWTTESLRSLVTHHARRLGLELPAHPRSSSKRGRPRYLDPTTRETLWRLHRVEGMSLRALGEWLAERGISTARGSSRWSPSSILCVIRSVDAEKRQADEQPAAAAAA